MKRTTADGTAEQVDLEALAEKQKVEKTPTSPWVAGEPAPEDEENPPPGKPGHRCIDPQGRYQPTWMSLYLEKNADTPMRQYVSANNSAGGYRITTGEWVDVPPEVVEVLRGCVYEEHEMRAVPTADGDVRRERVTRQVPRFSLSSLPSA
jgi:hypothetical protein